MDEHQAKSKSVTTDRTRIMWLWLAGYTARDIAAETGTSLSTVYRWIRRWEKEGTLVTRFLHLRSCTDYDGVFANSFIRPPGRTTTSSTMWLPKWVLSKYYNDHLLSYVNYGVNRTLHVECTLHRK
ncbi:hypothetical protein Pmani_028270 [Petrolisthes manimaculis]|uniref:Uncharacterized protein n=1 Tax=Petrolisthes manimaculis TaxID=1843537 RepID=A0AAE1P1Z8_9EUCA|nr:hypothetical protein Pmani_028270 [Petrolisthes manimaculis]